MPKKSKNDEVAKRISDHFKRLATDPEYRKECHERYERDEAEKRHNEFLKRNACPDCGTQMVERGSWTKGEIVFGGSCSSTELYQCPKCKTVRIE